MCKEPIDLDRLAAWWLAELPDAEGEQVEEHLFACARCTARLEWLAGLSEGVRALLREGKAALAVTPAFVKEMKRAGLRLREYHVEAGGSVNCTIRAEDDAVVSRVHAPLAGVGRVDVVRTISVGGVLQREMRLEDVPFDPDAGEVILVPSTAWVRGLPESTMRVRLLAVEEGRERPLGEYTFEHSPG